MKDNNIEMNMVIKSSWCLHCTT